MALETSLKIRVAPKITGKMPMYCSSCFQQDFKKIHIDFSSAWDGGTLRDAGGTLITIDDLVLCEDCVRVAANVLGHNADEKVIDELKVYKDRAIEQKRLRLGAEDRIKQLEAELKQYRDSLQ